MRGRVLIRVLAAPALIVAMTAKAIEAPRPAEPPLSAPDMAAFYQHLVTVSLRHELRALEVPAGIVDSIVGGRVADAVGTLEERASGGDREANVALVRVQHWCARQASAKPGDPQARAAELAAQLNAELAGRVAGVLRAEADYLPRVQSACAAAPLRLREIERRLREAAAAGHPASASELARFTRDAAKREQLLQAAADGGYAPAQHTLAVSRLVEVQRGTTTENVKTIRTLLKQAGTTLPAAKVQLANCMAVGCDGHPMDAATAARFGIDAARDGEPTAFAGMLRMPWRSSLSLEDIAAWQMFGERLNQEGCWGAEYVSSTVSFAQTRAQLEEGLEPDLLAAAQERADRYWKEFGARAIHEQLCEK